MVGVKFILCRYYTMTHRKRIGFHVSNAPQSHSHPPPEVRSGPEGLKQVQQAQVDSQTTATTHHPLTQTPG